MRSRTIFLGVLWGLVGCADGASPPSVIEGADAASGTWQGAQDVAADSFAPSSPPFTDAPPAPDLPAPSDRPAAPQDGGAAPDAGLADVPTGDVPTGDVPDGDVPDGDDAAFTCERIVDRTPVTLYLSADDSNSMASPTIVRRMIRTGRRVPSAVVRTYEFLNYYNVPYEAAPAGRVRIVPQMRPGLVPGSYELQVGIASERRAAAEVRPMTLTFVLDTSGSMAGGGRIERERAVLRSVAATLRPGDIVSAVTWNTAQRVVLSGHRVSGPSDPALVALASSIIASGGTDLSGGLRAGYDLARTHYGEGRLNRVVVVSDGEANVGETDARVIAEASHYAEREEIYLVGVGVGDGFNDTLMNTITDRGRGAYVFIDSDAEATEVFGRRFAETMDIAARAVRLELTLPWYMRVAEFHGEHISTNPREIDPQHLAPNDAMVFHQVLQACTPSAIDPADRIVARATYASRDRVASAERIETSFRDLLDAQDGALRRGRAIVAWAEALKRIDARGGRDVGDLDAVERLVREAPESATDPAMREILELVTRYRALAR
jgi:Ca-activated chloride channel family protein